MTLVTKLNEENENMWILIGQAAETMQQLDKALYAYENALRHNRFCVKALTQIASIYMSKDQFSKAVEFYQRAASFENNNASIWGSLGYCFLMMDDLQKAFTAYQQALKLTTAQTGQDKDPELWYGIGILYERCAHYADAVEAFTSVLHTNPNFEKANEIYFRLGIIYKQQGNYQSSLECFGYILANPPPPLNEADIWFQIGHVYELKKCFADAKRSYERVLDYSNGHAKVLQQLGWLYHINEEFCDQEVAIQYLRRSIQADPDDGQTWYLLGRCFMAQQKYRLAYDAYQQAVFRDGENPTFWCSIGLLYYKIGQTGDALHAYSRALRLNPGLSEVWCDLGALYESNDQISDAIEAYQRAIEFNPDNQHIKQKLDTLKAKLAGKTTGSDAGNRPAHNNTGHLESINTIEGNSAAHRGPYDSMQGQPGSVNGGGDVHSHISASPAPVPHSGAMHSGMHSHPAGQYPTHAGVQNAEYPHHPMYQQTSHQYPMHSTPGKGYPLAIGAHPPQILSQQQHPSAVNGADNTEPHKVRVQTEPSGSAEQVPTMTSGHVPPIRNLQVESSQKKRSTPTIDNAESFKRQKLDSGTTANGGAQESGQPATVVVVDDDDDDDDDEMVIKEDA